MRGTDGRKIQRRAAKPEAPHPITNTKTITAHKTEKVTVISYVFVI